MKWREKLAILFSGVLIISPAKNEPFIIPGTPMETIITVKNETESDLTLKLTTEDLVEREDGQYSLKNYLEYNREPFVLKAGEDINVPIKIVTPANLPPGGYYGTLYVGTVPDESISAEAKLSVRLGSLFFVTAPGPVTRQGELKDFGLIGSKIFWQKSQVLNFQMFYENSGNIYLNPYGQITISHPSGLEKKVYVDPWYVLPQTSRLREMEVRLGSNDNFWPGRYSAKLELNRGYEDIIDIREFNFWFLPWWFALVAGVIALVIILVLVRTVIKFHKP